MILSGMEIAQMVLGLVFFYILPGWMFVKIFFDDLKGFEKISIAFIISIMISLAVGVFFGYDVYQAGLLGGFTETNLWLAQFLITLLLATILLVKLRHIEKIERINKKLAEMNPLKKFQLPKLGQIIELDDKLTAKEQDMGLPSKKEEAKALKEKEERILKELKEIEAKKKAESKKQTKTRKGNFMADKWKALKEKKGLYQFIIRSIIFFGIIIGIYLIIFLWFRHTTFFIQNLSIDDNFYVSWLTGLRKTDFLNATVFAIIAFLVWNKDKLRFLPASRRSPIKTTAFGALAIMSLAAHYFLKYWIGMNQPIAASFTDVFTVLKLFLLLLFVLFLALAIYTKIFISWFLKKYWKPILIFSALGIVYFFLIQFFQLIWYELSYFVSTTIRSILSLTFKYVIFSPGTALNGPKLGVEGFVVGISNECSGIDSLLLFISLYVLLLALDWKKMNLKRMALLFIPGIIGTVAYNILRIYLLLLVGVYIDPAFAVDVFHTNIGWILFLLFFIIFWHFGSKWVYKKEKNIKKGRDKKRKKKKIVGKKKPKKN